MSEQIGESSLAGGGPCRRRLRHRPCSPRNRIDDLQERLDAEVWAQIMGRFVVHRGRGVRRFGGTVDKFTDDRMERFISWHGDARRKAQLVQTSEELTDMG